MQVLATSRSCRNINQIMMAKTSRTFLGNKTTSFLSEISSTIRDSILRMLIGRPPGKSVRGRSITGKIKLSKTFCRKWIRKSGRRWSSSGDKHHRLGRVLPPIIAFRTRGLSKNRSKFKTCSHPTLY